MHGQSTKSMAEKHTKRDLKPGASLDPSNKRLFAVQLDCSCRRTTFFCYELQDRCAARRRCDSDAQRWLRGGRAKAHVVVKADTVW